MESSLWNHFKDLDEPRRLTHILHPACNIIYITFAAILCGLRGWEDIADFGHGRVETRRCTLSTNLSYLADPGRWKGLAAIVKIHSERLNKRTGVTTREDRYFITTLKDTERVMNAVRKIALNLLAHDGFDHGKKKLSIKRKMLKAMLNQKYLEHLLSRL